MFKFTSQFYSRPLGYYWIRSGSRVDVDDLSSLNVGTNIVDMVLTLVLAVALVEAGAVGIVDGNIKCTSVFQE